MAGMANIPPAAQKPARAAAIGLPPAAVSMLRECFSQFHIDTAEPSDPLAALKTEKYEACVLPLNDTAIPYLEAARHSTANHRIVVYGVCSSPQEAMRFAGYGINAIFPESTLPENAKAPEGDRQGVMKVVRATHLLVVNELRRHIRIPVVTEVQVKSGDGRFVTTSQELSSGGVSLTNAPRLPLGAPVEVSFLLYEMPRLNIKASVSWCKPPDLLGISFDTADPRRLPLREWIDRYLEND